MLLCGLTLCTVWRCAVAAAAAAALAEEAAAATTAPRPHRRKRDQQKPSPCISNAGIPMAKTNVFLLIS